jgi:hypothetical protein
MKKVWTILFVAMLAIMSGNAMARDHYNDGGDDNSVRCNGRGSCDQSTTTNNYTTNKGGKGGQGGEGGTGIGIGIGKGGSAYTKVYTCVDTDIDNRNYNANVGIVKGYNDQDQKQGQLQGQGQDQDQNQGQDQGQSQKALSLQGQTLTNNGPQVVIEDNKVITYEAAASSAIAPDVNAPDPTADCRFSQGFSVAGSAVMAGGSIGHSTSEYDPICGAWMAASQTTGNAKTVATTVAYCMTMEETGVEVAQCDDWKGKVGRGLTEGGTWVAADATVAKIEEEEIEVVAFASARDR